MEESKKKAVGVMWMLVSSVPSMILLFEGITNQNFRKFHLIYGGLGIASLFAYLALASAGATNVGDFTKFGKNTKNLCLEIINAKNLKKQVEKQIQAQEENNE